MLYSCLLAIVISFILNIFAIKFSFKYNIFMDNRLDEKPQKMHKISTPRIGGFGIFASFFIFMLIYSFKDIFYFHIMISAFIVFLSGFLEDGLNTLSPKVRLTLQSIGVLYGLISLGAYLYDLNIGFELPFIIALLFSIFSVVGCINAINIIDGINGLSSGVSVLILCSIAFVGFESDNLNIFFCAMILCMACIGFLLLNYPFGKVFLGDGGAYTIGFIIALLLVILSQSKSNVSSWYGFLVMIYPIWECVFSIFRRKINKQRAMQPDGKHLHQLILKKLKNQTLTTLTIWLINLIFIILASIFYSHTIICMLISLIFICLYIFLYRKLSKI